MSKTEFLKQFDHIAATFPIQGKARADIHNGLDFPTIRDEQWKYTKVSGLISSEYKHHEVVLSASDIPSSDGLDAVQLTFVNGLFVAELSDKQLPDGMEVDSMTQASGERRTKMLEHLGAYAQNDGRAFNAFNTSYFKDGLFVTIKKGASIEKPIRIVHVISGDQQAANPRNLFILEENASASFITEYLGKNNIGSFCNALSEIRVNQGANGSLYLIQHEGDQSAQINATQVVQERDSTFKVVTVTKSGSLVRNNLNFDVLGEGCESNMYGMYFGNAKQHIDNHTYVDHKVPNCNSNELYKGVLSDQATGVFNGKIMVRQDAQQINAFQSNQNILLSDRASVNTKPELEIYADDVKCSHGCTIGQLDEEAMFYLQSRGLGKEAATKLLVHAFAADVTEHIDIDALKTDVESFIHEKFALIDA